MKEKDDTEGRRPFTPAQRLERTWGEGFPQPEQGEGASLQWGD